MGKRKGNPLWSGEKSCKKRKKMTPWIKDYLNEGTVQGLEWVDREKGIFQVPWTHASRQDYSRDQDSAIFKLWAEHTGKYAEGMQENPKTWKSNFRCALNSLDTIRELKDQSHRRGPKAARVYQFVDPKALEESGSAESSDSSAPDSPDTSEKSPELPPATHFEEVTQEEKYSLMPLVIDSTQHPPSHNDPGETVYNMSLLRPMEPNVHPSPTRIDDVPSPSNQEQFIYDMGQVPFYEQDTVKAETQQVVPPSPHTDTELASDIEDQELSTIVESVMKLQEDFPEAVSPLRGNPMLNSSKERSIVNITRDFHNYALPDRHYTDLMPVIYDNFPNPLHSSHD